jgi:hypothetical protein
MANTRTPHARLAFVIVLAVVAAMGVGCAPTAAMPLPMLASGYSSAQASASHAHAPVAHGTAARPSAR